MLGVLLGCVAFLVMMAGLFVPLEAFFPAQRTKPRARAMALGVALFVANTMLMQVLGVPVLQVVGVWGLARSGSAALAVLVFVLADLVGYWVHRAMHRVPLLWRFHRLHHEATELSWLDAWRQHPVDFVLHGVAVGLPGALLGASLTSLASVVVLRKAFTTYLHANVPGSFGPWLASPAFHRVHHGADPRLYDTNFAGTFPLWDVLFGTQAGVGSGQREAIAANEGAFAANHARRASTSSVR